MWYYGLLLYKIYVVWRPGECESRAWIYLCVHVECDCLWCWWYWDEMIIDIDDDIDMRWYWCWFWYWDEMIVDVDDDIEIGWHWCWWWDWDEMMLMLMMSSWWMYVVYVHGGCSDLLDIFWKGKGIGLRISSVSREGRGFLRNFNYPQSVYWWCPCFILHNCMEIV